VVGPASLAESLSRAIPPRERRDAFRAAAPDDEGVAALLADLPKLRRRDPEGAVRAAKTALAAARAAGRPRLASRASAALGNALLFLGRPRDALRRLRAASAEADPVRRAELAPGVVHALSVLGRTEEARIEIAESRGGLPARGARSLRGLLDAAEGQLLERTDRPAEALAAFDRARSALGGSPGSRAVAASIDVSRGNLLANLDRHAAAERLFVRVARYHRGAGQEAAALAADYNRAYLLYLRGAFHDALERFDALRSRFGALGDRRHVALCDVDAAEVHLRMNLSAEAARRAKSAAEAFDALGMAQDAARARFFLAVARRPERSAADSLEALASSTEELHAVGCVAWAEMARHRWAEALRETGLWTEAKAAAVAAARRLEELGLRERAGRAECLVATLETETGEAEAALRRLESLRRRTADLYAPWLRCEISHRASLACAELGKRRTAALHALRAARTLERHRVSAPPDEYMAAFLRDKAAVHANAVRCVLALGGRNAARLAFEVAEEGKGRALVDLLRRGQAASGTVARDRLHREVDRLGREIDGLVGRIPGTEGTRGPGPEATARAAEVRAERLRRCLDLLAVRDASAARERGAPAARAADVRKALLPGTALLQYAVDADAICAFVLSREGVDVVRWKTKRDDLRRAVQRVSFHLDRPPSIEAAAGGEAAAAFVRAAEAALDALGEQVLGPVRERIRTKRLVVVPHAELHGVPFHALRVGGRALVEDVEVVTAPSASVWLHCVERDLAGTRRCVVLGVPDEAAPLLEREAEEVGAIHGVASTRIGPAATRQALARLGRSARVVHIASHGSHRRDDPMLSGLLLGDGWLTLEDLLGIRLGADTLVLSGCATGQSWVTEGDDLFGLVRGFLHAGVREFVGSLWRVSDGTATDFMLRFHRALAGGADAATALRRATLEIREIHPHPHDWAPFVLTGAGCVPAERLSCTVE
jgi:hypothetical protein